MKAASVRLVLAFDASCAQCRRISAAVARVTGDKLEVLPLNNSEVRSWRKQWFGDRAPWAPTLIRVVGDDLKIRTGRGMVIPLLRGLGPRSTVRVLRALGELRNQPQESVAEPDAMGRKRFLWLAGAAVAAGLVLRGRTPASAETAGAWAEANRGRLPQRYDQVAALPVEYRRAVFIESPAQVRTQLWLDHLDTYRAAHPDLTKAQTAVIDRARTLVPTAFTGSREAVSPELAGLKEDAIGVFGRDQATALLATLGPPAEAASAAKRPDCECANLDPFCGPFPKCSNYPVSCNYDDSGCGTFWAWPCDGMCHF